MSHHQIARKYPGKTAGEIYARVDEVMKRIAEKLSLHYDRDGEQKTGKVHKMGISGTYRVRDGEVVVELSYPMLVPGSMKQKVQQDIESKLDGLFA
jgi:hypothetical protein